MEKIANGRHHAMKPTDGIAIWSVAGSAIVRRSLSEILVDISASGGSTSHFEDDPTKLWDVAVVETVAGAEIDSLDWDYEIKPG